MNPKPSIRSASPAYLCLLLHATSSLLHQRYIEVLAHQQRSPTAALAVSTIGAGIIAIPFGLLSAFVVKFLQLTHCNESSRVYNAQPSPLQLPSLPFTSMLPVPLLALSILFSPTYTSTPPTAHIPQITAIPLSISFITESTVCTVLCLTFVPQWPGLVDLVIGGLLFNGEMLELKSLQSLVY
jgi:hypothetical protein